MKTARIFGLALDGALVRSDLTKRGAMRVAHGTPAKIVIRSGDRWHFAQMRGWAGNLPNYVAGEPFEPTNGN